MRRLGIAICLLSLWAAPVWAEENDPDPADENEQECPDNYHPVEGLDNACAQDDGYNDGNDTCPPYCSNISPWTDAVCNCEGYDTWPYDDGNPWPTDCPDGFGHSDSPYGVGPCVPTWSWEPMSPEEFWTWGDDNLVIRTADGLYVYDENLDLVVHFDIDPEKGCEGVDVYDYTRDSCEPACEFLVDVPCPSPRVFWQVW